MMLKRIHILKDKVEEEMNKRVKHITVNLTDEDYKCLCFIASKQRRKTSEAAYLILSDMIHEMILKEVDLGSSGFKKPKFISEE